MRHTRILNSDQKVFGIYITDYGVISILWFVTSNILPNSFKGVDLVIILCIYSVVFLVRSKYRRGFLSDFVVTSYYKIFHGGVYVHRIKNNWSIFKR